MHNYRDIQLIFNREQYREDREYWRQVLQPPLPAMTLPHEAAAPFQPKQTAGRASLNLDLPAETARQAIVLGKNNDVAVFVVLLSALHLFLHQFTRNRELLVQTPLLKVGESTDMEQRFNRFVLLRSIMEPPPTVKQLLTATREYALNAYRHQDFPLELALDKKEKKDADPVLGSRIAVSLREIHHIEFMDSETSDWNLAFERTGDSISCVCGFNPKCATQEEAIQWFQLYQKTLHWIIGNLDTPLRDLNRGLFDRDERLLHILTNQAPQGDHVQSPDIHLTRRAGTAPHCVALEQQDLAITYGYLERRVSRLAAWMKADGIRPGDVVAALCGDDIHRVTAMLACLRARAVYLPIDNSLPNNRVLLMLADSNARGLLTFQSDIQDFGFSRLAGIMEHPALAETTGPRAQVRDLDQLAVPDRGLVSYKHYQRRIGQAMVTNSMSVQWSRGCVYRCAYCFKIWSEKYVMRSAEHIFAELKTLYDQGIRRFNIVDDLPNIDIENASRLFRLIIDHGLKIHLHFPNGIRGDILTEELIDLMVAAGTVTMDLALETASPRLQKLVRKHLNLERLQHNIRYITERYPQVLLELQILHGIPTETEEEAMRSLEFIQNIHWVHFPYIHVLNIYPGSEMARIAIENGVPEEAIRRSANMAYHELPETLPFDHSFSRRYQAQFLEEYFLNKERLLAVLPHQMTVLTEDELVQKYDSYLPVEIGSFQDLLDYAGIEAHEIKKNFLPADFGRVPDIDEKFRLIFPRRQPASGAIKVLLLDVTQYFASSPKIRYDVVEPPLGLMSVMSHLNDQLGANVDGKIAKSGIDYSSFQQLRELLEDFQPDLIGIRGLNFFRDFFHQTVAAIRRSGLTAPIVAGGPYATSSYSDVLKDPGVDVCVLGEGEITFCQLVTACLENECRLPDDSTLRAIKGLAFVPRDKKNHLPANRNLLLLDQIPDDRDVLVSHDQLEESLSQDPAYIIYTSGSTGLPKGVVVTRSNLARQVAAIQQVLCADESLRTVLLAAPGFDVWLMHASLAISSGGTLVTVPSGVKTDGNALWNLVARQRVNLLNTVPALLDSLLTEDIDQPVALRWLLVGGARFSTQLLSNVSDSNLKVRHIINIYGPTETTINATYYPCRKHCDPIPIGVPLPGYEAAILDERLNILPPGVAGEIAVSGAGVAAGYLNRPDLTAEVFKDHPGFPGQRIYTSGDLGLIDSNRQIQFLGRVDRQVKVRGVRVEPAEIERAISAWLPDCGVKVTLRSEGNDSNYLCAYIETKQQLDSDMLRRRLEESLPAAVIPSYFIRMERFPLNVNGKVDDSRLPDPRAAMDIDSQQPQNRLERQLRELWADVVGLEPRQVGMTADFFQMGGHSLHATIILSRIHKLFSVKLHLEDFFKSSTIRSLAQVIESRTSCSYTGVQPAEKKEYYPLSHAQKRLYFMQQMQPESSAYNLPLAVRISGPLDCQRVESIFQQLLTRHQSLRVSFFTYNGQVFQKEHPRPPFAVQHVEASISPRQEANGELESYVQSFIRHFDLTRPPLMRVSLLRFRPDEYLLMVDVHHIVADGLSTRVLIREFMTLYEGGGLKPLGIQYLDFAHWQNSPPIQQEMKRQETYWLERFTNGIPVLELPLDFPRAPQPEFIGNTVKVPLDPSWQSRLRKLADLEGATMYMVVLAVCYLWLAKLSSQDEIVIGLTTGGRNHPELEPVIGMFANTLAANVTIDRDSTFRDFLRRVKEATLEAFDNQDYPFEDLVDQLLPKRDPARNPLFDVAFGWWEEDAAVTAEGVKLRDLDVRAMDYENRSTLFDMLVSVIDENNRLSLSVEYCTKLFLKETIDHWLVYFKRIVAHALDDSDCLLRDIDCFLPDQQLRRTLLREWGDHPGQYQTNVTIMELFSRQCRRTPDAVAVTDGEQWTFSHLRLIAASLAAELTRRGIGPGSIVPLVLDRSHLMIAGMLGIALSGAAYAPVDPDYPPIRIQFVLDDVASPLWLSRRGLEIELSHQLPPLYIDDILESEPDTEPRLPEIAADSPLYVIYTSGTTGKPKGVVISHRNVARLMTGDRFQFQFGASDHWTMFHSYCFDFSVWEMYGALLYGGNLVIVPRLTAMDSRRFSLFLRRHTITVLNQTPSAFYRLLEEELVQHGSGLCLRTVIFGGEALDPSRLKPFADQYPDVRLINMYGITETTVHVTYKRLSPKNLESGASIVGRPIPTLRTYVLDEDLRLLPPGLPGQLAVGGDGVALGYLNRPELTAQTFIQSPFDKDEIIYLSGDQARWTYDGELEYKGRIDSQIKIRGFRIEIGEVEHYLATHPAVRRGVVAARPDLDGQESLVAYVETVNRMDAGELKDYLHQYLPSYMIPSLFCFIEQIPLTSNGKVDRRNLPDPMESGAETAAPHEPMNSIEAEVAAQWASVLQVPVDTLGPKSDFFTLGGHSLRATVLIAQLEERFGIRVPIPIFFNAPTIAGLARYIGENQKKNNNSSGEQAAIHEAGLDYWSGYLAGFQQRTPMPHRRTNSDAQPYDAGVVELALPDSLHAGLGRTAASLHVTSNILLQTIWGVLLGRLNHSQDSLFGAMAPVNFVPVRVKLHGNPGFSVLAGIRAQEATQAQNYEYPQLASLQSVLNMDGGLFDHIMVFDNVPVEEQTTFDFNLLALPGETLLLKALFNRGVFRRRDVLSMLQRLMRAAEQVVKRPEIPVGEIDLLAADEKKDILSNLCRGRDQLVGEQTLAGWFRQVVSQYPGRKAAAGMSIRTGTFCQLTYSQIERQASSMAGTLIQKGTKPGAIVAVLAEPSVEIAGVIWGILKTGAVYLPVDPSLPKERIEYMLADAGADIVIGSPEHIPVSLKNLDIINPEVMNTSLKNGNQAGHIEDPHLTAYVIYTSGSTGRPKGVAVSSHSLINLCRWHQKAFHVTNGDRASQYASLGFDASVWEMFPYWLTGAAIVFVDPETRPDMVKLNAFFARHSVTVAFLPTPVYELFSQHPNDCLRLVLTGGDALRTVNKQSYPVYNNYGPTENTVVSSSVLLQGGETEIPIGRPVDNCRVYVLDEFLHPQPKGIPGEVWLAGDNLAQGYLNRPELTAQRFQTIPGLPETCLYRSGDLGRWNDDGNLEFLGRVDQQVKIRGYRIELEEIEAHILRIAGVRQAAVELRRPQGKDPILVAYVAVDLPPAPQELTRRLAQRLPAYMIPSRFFTMDSLPLTVNGKIDRAALPELGAASEFEVEPPHSRVESRLRDLWAEILDLEPETIGVRTGFFQLGGHSLHAATLAGMIQKEFARHIRLTNFFKHDTIRALARLIEQSVPIERQHVETAEIRDTYPLTAAQKRIYILQMMDPELTVYNMPMVIGLDWDIDPWRVEQALYRLIKRHHSLRSAFGPVEGTPAQWIDEIDGFTLDGVVDVNDVESLRSHLERFIRPFNLARPPLIRALLLQTGTERMLAVDVHHIAADGMSLYILQQEFSALLAGEDLPPLELEYKDVAVWQQGEAYHDSLRRQKGFWLELFSELPEPLVLPYDRPRPEIQDFQGAQEHGVIRAAELQDLLDLASRNGSTLFMALAAVFFTLLHRLSGQSDIVVGTPVAGRRLQEFQPIVGMFVGTLPLRATIAGDQQFSDVLSRVRELSIQAFENQDYPFEQLVEQLRIPRDPGRNPLFDVMLALQNFVDEAAGANDPQVPQSAMESGEFATVSRFDMTWSLSMDKGDLFVDVEYSTRLFNKTTIQTFIADFKHLVMAAGSNPKQTLARFQLASKTCAPRSPKPRQRITDRDTEISLQIPMQLLSPLEDTITRLWSRVLAIPKEEINGGDDFFALGGHSLAAGQLANLITEETGVSIPWMQIFKAPTIRRLAEYIEGLTGETASHIPPREEMDYYPATPQQKRMLALQALDPGSTVYNLQLMAPVPQELSLQRLQMILDTLVQRHESLRTYFQIFDNQPVMRVLDQAALPIQPVDDLSAVIAPFDLAQAPLARGFLLAGSGDARVLVMDMHHIITDGWSVAVLHQEFLTLLNGEDLPQLSIHYRDYACWWGEERQRAMLERQQAFWMTSFAEPVAPLELPYDRPRPAKKDPAGAMFNFALPPEETEELERAASRHHTTMFMMTLSLLYILLHRVSGQEDIVIGTPVDGRSHPQTEPLVGLFVNTLALRGAISGRLTVAELLALVRETVSQALLHRDFPFDQLVETIDLERDPSRNPLFDIMLSWIQADAETNGSQPLATEDINPVARLDMTWGAQVAHGRLEIGIEYSTSLFDRRTIQRFASYFKRIAAVIARQPRQRIFDIECLSSSEKEELIWEFNDTKCDYPDQTTVHQIFADIVRSHPDKIALALPDGWGNVSYSRLNREANALARTLITEGLAQGNIAAVLAVQGFWKIVSILAIQKAGGAYLPLDTEAPPERTAFMLRDSGAVCLLTDSNLSIRDYEGETISLELKTVTENDDLNPDIDVQPDAPLYVIYTSGTTGRPKGVMVEHRNVVQLLKNDHHPFQFSHNDIWTMFHSYCFDFSVWEMYGPLLYGGKLVFIPRGLAKDPGAFADLLEREAVTVLNQTPSAFYHLIQISDHHHHAFPSLKMVIFGGEALNPGKLFSWKQRHPHVQLINMFGITETTVHSSVRSLSDTDLSGSASIIGKPIPNTRIYVLDHHLRLMPRGAAGELFVGGAGVARGYVNRPELTAERFIPHPFLAGERLYKSGDRGRYCDEEGNLEHLGRGDQQIKIRGFRVEPGEIERVLLDHKAVAEAVVLPHQDPTGDSSLIAYLVLAAEGDGEMKHVTDDIRSFLAGKVPAYMVPAEIVCIETIPLTVNGKLDRSALPQPGGRTINEQALPETGLQREIAEIWANVLGVAVEQLSIDLSFWQMGGHSLKAALLADQLSRSFFMSQVLHHLYSGITIRQLAHMLETTPMDNKNESSSPLVRLTEQRLGTPRIVCIHGAAGDVRHYYQLAQSLPPRFEVWAIQAPNRRHSGPWNMSMRRVADHYLEMLTETGDSQPVLLVGWSAGAAVALAMAIRMEERGQALHGLALIDSPPPAPHKETGAPFSPQGELEFVRNFIPGHETNLGIKDEDLDIPGIWKRVADWLASHREVEQEVRRLIAEEFGLPVNPREHIAIHHLLDLANRMRSFHRLSRAYYPETTVSVPSLVVKAADSTIPDIRQWEKWFKRPPVFQEIPGDHHSIFQPPHVRAMAGIISDFHELLRTSGGCLGSK